MEANGSPVATLIVTCCLCTIQHFYSWYGQPEGSINSRVHCLTSTHMVKVHMCWHMNDGACHQVGLGTGQAWRVSVDTGGHALHDRPEDSANHMKGSTWTTNEGLLGPGKQVGFIWLYLIQPLGIPCKWWLNMQLYTRNHRRLHLHLTIVWVIPIAYSSILTCTLKGMSHDVLIPHGSVLLIIAKLGLVKIGKSNYWAHSGGHSRYITPLSFIRMVLSIQWES